ncbi:hypothetical protein F0310_05580 (plasmid) [Borrelia sp. A-FGy1]|uniref:hypothetical protein n=1 Tax=Borrelia sp. A-FGy1 TaxID=2608247 RepID=UPI0015F3AF88|nr:hypothetical protein [Borrelia sp. A-FGy1]QMU99879.1 hypothetical protein F0310_05580 [Borrelia sp. A-FGy1]
MLSIKSKQKQKVLLKRRREEKNESVDNLKTVRSILAVIKKTTETACLAYAYTYDFVVIVTSSLSSSKFRQAASKFNEVAKKYANGKGDNAASVIVGVISGIAYHGFEDWWFNNAKRFASNPKVTEINKMIAIIDKLLEVYKRVK